MTFTLTEIAGLWTLTHTDWPEARITLGPLDDGRLTDWSALKRRLGAAKGITFKGARLAVYGPGRGDEATARRTVQEIGGMSWRLPSEAEARAVLYLIWRVERAPLVAAQVGALSQLHFAVRTPQDEATRQAMALAWPEYIERGAHGQIAGLTERGEAVLGEETRITPRPLRGGRAA